ncbi:hypothetical protein CQW23_27835 [Capsicum baccatum]|uniref:Uncharacterized protein n=1 Tax=Capsicum baccatum TaxID=33114 RepID=A0A2G2VEX2_CAPBA|nr:hypothetical protein CQW23_27835 [Capsicum baccatum]
MFSIADIYHEDEKELSLEKQLTVEPMAAVFMNFECEDVEECEETIYALTGMGSYSHAPKKLDLDLKNRPSPPAKPSIEESPVLKLKELPSHLKRRLVPNFDLKVSYVKGGKLGMKEQRLSVRHCLCKSRQRTRQGLCHCLCSLPQLGNGQGKAYTNLGNEQGKAYVIAYAHCLN